MKKLLVGLLVSLCFVFTAAPVSAEVDLNFDGTFSAEDNIFSDVQFSDWFFDEVLYAEHMMIMVGTSSTTFSPMDDMTRGQFVTVLSHFGEGDDYNNYDGYTYFSDVPVSAYYTWGVNWAYERGIVDGVGNNKFAPNSPIKREEIARIIDNYITKYSKENGVSVKPYDKVPEKFNDASTVSSWAKQGVENMRIFGIMQGDNFGNFKPQSSLIRAEGAVISAKFFEIFFDLQHQGVDF